MADHERSCFARTSGLPAERIACHDLLQGPPGWAVVRNHDVLSVGGSGDFYVSKRDLPHFDAFLDLLREVVATGHPMFASCFGYQSLVAALGGEVVHEPENSEVGTYELTLTPEGREDPLLGQLPARFWAQMGHKDRANTHGGGLPNLASSERSPLQALRIPNQPIWATQFHPELDRQANQDRFEHYLRGYSAHMTREEQEAVRARSYESAEVTALFPAFLRLVFGLENAEDSGRSG